jgi:hypothetical protein
VGEGAAQCVCVSDGEDSFECCRGEGYGALLAPESQDFAIFDEHPRSRFLVTVGAEPVEGGSGGEPSLLVLDGDVSKGFGALTFLHADGVNGVACHAEGPPLAVGEAVEEGEVGAGFPAGGGWPTGLFDEVFQVWSLRAGDVVSRVK